MIAGIGLKLERRIGMPVLGADGNPSKTDWLAARQVITRDHLGILGLAQPVELRHAVERVFPVCGVFVAIGRSEPGARARTAPSQSLSNLLR